MTESVNLSTKPGQPHCGKPLSVRFSKSPVDTFLASTGTAASIARARCSKAALTSARVAPGSKHNTSFGSRCFCSMRFSKARRRAALAVHPIRSRWTPINGADAIPVSHRIRFGPSQRSGVSLRTGAGDRDQGPYPNISCQRVPPRTANCVSSAAARGGEVELACSRRFSHIGCSQLDRHACGCPERSRAARASASSSRRKTSRRSSSQSVTRTATAGDLRPIR